MQKWVLQKKKKYDVIKDIIEGKITKKEAEFSLGLTRRQINRLILKLNKEGISAFSHKNKGNLYNKKLSIDIENEIIDLYITDYYDYNFLHFYEEINSKYKLSFSSLVAILKKQISYHQKLNIKQLKYIIMKRKRQAMKEKLMINKYYYL